MRIRDIKGPFPNFQQLDRAAREKKGSKNAQTADALSELTDSICTLNPNLSNSGHNRYYSRHLGDFVL